MTQTHLTTRWGNALSNPSLDEMQSALAELATPDAEHPDCWLSDESGWSVSAHQGGKAILENLESGEGPWYLTFESPDAILQLWLALQAGELESIRKHPWREGYGS